MKKSITIVMLIIMICIFFQVPVRSYATSIEEIMGKGKSFISKGSGSSPISESDLEPTFIPVGQLLVGIGDAVITVVAGIMGIQFITASPDKKAKLKQQCIGLVVSVVVINGAVIIWQTARTFMENF